MTDELEAIGKGFFMNAVPEGGMAATWFLSLPQKSSILFGAILVPIIESDYILRLGIVCYIRNDL